MFEFMTSIVNDDGYWPFVLSLFVMVGICGLEIITGLIGLGLLSFFDTCLPDLNIDIDVDADINFGHSVLGWLNIGEVPTIILLIIFLTTFGLTGVAVQLQLVSFGIELSPWLTSIGIFFVALVPVRVIGGWIAKVMPKTQTMALSSDAFISKVATIETGDARIGSPAQAVLIDDYDKEHRVLVEPMESKEVFKQGSKVVLIEKDEEQNFIFKCVLMEEF